MVRQEKLSAQFRSGEIEIKEESLIKLEKILSERHHFSLSSYGRNYLKRRIKARLQSLGLNSLSQYLKFLEKHLEEGEKLIQALTISLTSFFRDRETFQILSEKVVPELLRFSLEHQIELWVWSAGCATGEEAYSLGMIFLEKGKEIIEKVGLRILGTDLDQSAIKFAQQGIYPKNRFSSLAPELVRNYFQEHPRGYQVRSFLKKLVHFQKENLLSSDKSGLKRVDLIMCRNLLIYLEPEEQGRLLSHFDRALRPGGYLVLGKTEFLSEPYRSKFETVSLEERVYKKLFELA